MRLLICGSREWTDREFLEEQLDHLAAANDIEMVITGAARGADTMGSDWAAKRGIDQQLYPADWNRYGKRAGFIRNEQMLEQGKPDRIVAFIKGRSVGTRMMIKLGMGARVTVDVWDATRCS